MSWTPERIADLEKLWAEGLSTAEIGRRLGVSKNAVVGKAHRLSLPGRQSPIDPKRRAAGGRKPAARARTAPQQPKPNGAPAAPQPAAAAESASAAQAAAPPPPPRRRQHRHSGPSCQWPFGDPRLPGFHFCGAPATPGKPYCDEHCAVAYSRVSTATANARADAAAEAA